MQLFLNGEAEFLNGGGVVKNMAKNKNMGANMAESLERGPFGVFKGTILNGGGGGGIARTHSRPPPPKRRHCTVLY